jgi:zinc D-Ala-D-Ala carboxypeptidase
VNLTQHFTLEEFAASDTAARLGIDNAVPPELMTEARRTCELLERIRARLSRLVGQEVPIVVTSGYRCLQLNRAIGSADASDHVLGKAVDFKAGRFGNAFQVAGLLAPLVGELEIGQLIHEYGSWVHVSTRRPEKPVNRIITISRRGTEPGILEA